MPQARKPWPNWAAIGAFAGLLSAVAAVGVYILTTIDKSRGLEVSLISVASVIDSSSGVWGDADIAVLIDGRTVENFSIVTIRIANNGNTPIRPTDFEGSIEIDLDGMSEIFGVNVKDTNPNSLRPSLSVSENTVHLSPLLLNQDDMILMEASGATTLKSSARLGNVRARIAGVNNVAVSDTTKSDRELITDYKDALNLIVSLVSGISVLFAAFAASVWKRTRRDRLLKDELVRRREERGERTASP